MLDSGGIRLENVVDDLSAHSFTLRDLNPNTNSVVVTETMATHGPRLDPRKVIRIYEPDEWELFIEEWATSLQGSYVNVQRFGGSGDQGVDVAAFSTKLGFQGNWHCFQGKHYEKSLTRSHVWPEILKLFLLLARNPLYTMPTKYSFVAPRGAATSLAHVLSAPAVLQSEFLSQVSTGTSKVFAELSPEDRAAVLKLAKEADFSIFECANVRELIDQHSTTKYHTQRFGGGLPVRPAADAPPEEVLIGESIYVQKLIEAYSERYFGVESLETVWAHEKAGAHLRRQREAFYRAESLKSFARDSLPARAFEGLQDELFDAVIETVEGEHVYGLTRLQKTLEQAVSAQLTNALIQVTEPADRKGICHQLANDDRLTWVVKDDASVE